MSGRFKEWNGATVQAWLECRVVSALADQVAAEKLGREGHDDCDRAAAEEMVCTLLKSKGATDSERELLDALTELLDREEYVCRGVYNDTRFDRHVRSYVRKLVKMTKSNHVFDNGPEPSCPPPDIFARHVLRWPLYNNEEGVLGPSHSST